MFAILRRLEAAVSCRIAHALAESGIRALEVTIDSPGALGVIERLRAELPEVRVGAGTILDPSDVDRAAAAGAQFLVSPHVDPDVIRACASAGLPAIPGAATATESISAWRAGATLVKLFPAHAQGVATLRALREPLPMLPFVAVGGVDGNNAAAYIEAGACAVGIGSWLAAGGDLELASERAREVVQRLAQPQSGAADAAA